MPPLPPRPNKPTEQNAPDLVEHTLIEQEVGRENVQTSKSRFEEEQEAGRKLVAYNEERRAKRLAAEKITKDSEQK